MLKIIDPLLEMTNTVLKDRATCTKVNPILYANDLSQTILMKQLKQFIICGQT